MRHLILAVYSCSQARLHVHVRTYYNAIRGPCVHLRAVCHAKRRRDRYAATRKLDRNGLRVRFIDEESFSLDVVSTFENRERRGGNGYYGSVVRLKLSRCTLTFLQRPDWYDRFVVSARSRTQVPESCRPDFKCRYLTISTGTYVGRWVTYSGRAHLGIGDSRLGCARRLNPAFRNIRGRRFVRP